MASLALLHGSGWSFFCNQKTDEKKIEKIEQKDLQEGFPMILCADLHLRKSCPKARKDNYWEAQEKKFRFILKLAEDETKTEYHKESYVADVERGILLVAGDFFNTAKSDPFLEQWVIEILRKSSARIVVVPGQHDLVNHSLELFKESSLAVLNAAGVIELLGIPREGENYSQVGHGFNGVINGWAYGSKLELIYGNSYPEKDGGNILVWHNIVIKDDPLWTKQIANTGERILRKYPDLQLIVTGDNHQTFVCQNKGRYLINPGSMMRLKTSQKDHKPCVFRWDKGNLEQIFLPIEEDVFDDSHITEKEEKESRLDGFITKLNEIRPELNENSSVSFKGNLKSFFQVNKDMRDVEEITWRCVPNDRK